ncbi:MAG: DUF3991 and toprim domain-containing protein [Clostridiales bacterium]|nr:DUF3991 and toprim domain-containing protein [Clostridiales bacterium]
MIDNKTIELARNTDLIAFFEQRFGFTFTNYGGAYRCKQHPSLAVKNDRLSWYWHSKRIGGHGVLDYLIKVENMPFREAVEAVTGAALATAQPRQEVEQPKTLILPEKAGIPIRLFEYLCLKRGIDGEIVNALIQEEKLYEDKRGNVVFIGHDENCKARFASLRGTYGDCRFRMDCPGSDKHYGFNMAACAPSDRLYVFESPIDAMSHGSLANAATGDKEAWERHSRLSLAGTSDAALIFFLNQRFFIKELVFCLDNDPAGCEASVMLAHKYAEKSFRTQIELPKGKDFNDDLIANLTKKARQKRTGLRHQGMSI